MKIDVITIFPELFGPFLECSLIGKALQKGIIDVNVVNLRDFAFDKHKTVDDTPYGGGPGMVMKPEPWFLALESLALKPSGTENTEIILLSPKGERLDQKLIDNLAAKKHLVMMCGRYEDIDGRVRDNWVTREVSLGDYVLNGGELPAQVIIEGVTRLLPGAIGDFESARNDSFYNGILDHQHFTKPVEYRGLRVPDVLTSGDHEAIRRWRLRNAIEITYEKRPDLLDHAELTEEQEKILRELVGKKC